MAGIKGCNMTSGRSICAVVAQNSCCVPRINSQFRGFGVQAKNCQIIFKDWESADLQQDLISKNFHRLS